MAMLPGRNRSRSDLIIQLSYHPEQSARATTWSIVYNHLDVGYARPLF